MLRECGFPWAGRTALSPMLDVRLLTRFITYLIPIKITLVIANSSGTTRNVSRMIRSRDITWRHRWIYKGRWVVQYQSQLQQRCIAQKSLSLSVYQVGLSSRDYFLDQWVFNRIYRKTINFQQQAFRTLVTAPPPPSGQPAPNPIAKKSSNNTLLYTVLGAAAAGSAYYYFTQDQEKYDELKATAKAEDERLKSKARGVIDTVKDKSAETEERTREEYRGLKVRK